MKITVAIIFGGKSVEHEVSIISGIQAIMNMNTDKYEIIPIYLTKCNEMYVGEDISKIESYKDINTLLKKSQRVIMLNDNNKVFLHDYHQKAFFKKKSIGIDVVFPIVHGTNVEDGTLQGYFKTLGVPFVGSDVMASAIGMDKDITKAILKNNDIPVLDCKVFTISDYANIERILDRVEKDLGYPVIVKPANLGSSVGISIAKDRVELTTAVDDAFCYAKKIIVEHAILNLREINCAVLGDAGEAIASECEEPLHTHEILSYEDKYLSNSKNGGQKGMASVSRKIPANIPAAMKEKIQGYAVKAFQCLDCNGVARIDFMIDEDSNELYFNEINTIPGSLAFYLWEPVGISYSELLDRMIQLALKRTREEETLTFTFNTNILDQQSLSGAKGGKL